MKIKKENIISITEFARNTKQFEENLDNGPLAVVKNGKTVFIAARPNANYSDIRKMTMNYEETTRNDYLTKLAKMNIKENIYFLMRFESPNITFPNVETIMDGGTIKTEYKFEKQVTLDLVDAWKNILNSEEELSVEYIINLNETIAKHQALKVGQLRDDKVFISGTTFMPEIPTIESLKNKLSILKQEDPIEFATEYLVWAIKSQLFFDGNKRTSILIANKILKDAGVGLLSIHEKDLQAFNELLNEYYNNESTKNRLKKFLVEECIYNTPTREFHNIA